MHISNDADRRVVTGVSLPSLVTPENVGYLSQLVRNYERLCTADGDISCKSNIRVLLIDDVWLSSAVF